MFAVTALSPIVAVLTLMLTAREIERLYELEPETTSYFVPSLWLMTAAVFFMTVAPFVALITARVMKHPLRPRGVFSWSAIWGVGLAGFLLFMRT
jgi:hypothetical protein